MDSAEHSIKNMDNAEQAIFCAVQKTWKLNNLLH